MGSGHWQAPLCSPGWRIWLICQICQIQLIYKGQNSWTPVRFYQPNPISFSSTNNMPLCLQMASSMEGAKLFLQYSSYPFPSQHSSYLFPSQHSGLKLLVEEIDEEKKKWERHWQAEDRSLAFSDSNLGIYVFFLLLSANPVYQSTRMSESEVCPVSSGSICPILVQAVECVPFNKKNLPLYTTLWMLQIVENLAALSHMVLVSSSYLFVYLPGNLKEKLLGISKLSGMVSFLAS